VLDDSGLPAPIGVPGELCISGLGVSRGYWRRSDLTAEKFVADPFRPAGQGRLYRTGDLARWRSDGVLEFLSRLDGQVKVRGFRVELSEIEATLCQHEEVIEAAVTYTRRDRAERVLAAHYTTPASRTVRPDQLREFLLHRLPDYMIPAKFVPSASLPRTPSGKIDRLALPACVPASPTTTTEFVAPRSPLEQEISRLWCEVLGLERVGVNDNFFEIGGHSLIAGQLFARLRKMLKIDLPLRQLYERPTIAALAELIISLQLERGDRQRMAALFARVESMSEEKALLTLGAENAALHHGD
jgi:acyl carrier protein